MSAERTDPGHEEGTPECDEALARAVSFLAEDPTFVGDLGNLVVDSARRRRRWELRLTYTTAHEVCFIELEVDLDDSRVQLLRAGTVGDPDAS